MLLAMQATINRSKLIPASFQSHQSRPRGSFHHHNTSANGTQSVRGSFQSQNQSQGIMSQRGSSRASSKFPGNRRKSTERDELGKVGAFRRRSSANATKVGKKPQLEKRASAIDYIYI